MKYTLLIFVVAFLMTLYIQNRRLNNNQPSPILYEDLNHPELGPMTLEAWRKIGATSLKGEERLLIKNATDDEKLIGLLYLYNNINLNERS